MALGTPIRSAVLIDGLWMKELKIFILILNGRGMSVIPSPTNSASFRIHQPVVNLSVWIMWRLMAARVCVFILGVICSFLSYSCLTPTSCFLGCTSYSIVICAKGSYEARRSKWWCHRAGHMWHERKEGNITRAAPRQHFSASFQPLLWGPLNSSHITPRALRGYWWTWGVLTRLETPTLLLPSPVLWTPGSAAWWWGAWNPSFTSEELGGSGQVPLHLADLTVYL